MKQYKNISSLRTLCKVKLCRKLLKHQEYHTQKLILMDHVGIWERKKESWLYQKSHTGSPPKIFNVEILHLLTNYLSIRSCDTVAVDLLEPHPWILCSAKSQRCSVRLRSGDCGWYLWTVMFMFKKLVWDHLNLVNAVLSCWMQGHEHSYQQYSGKCLNHVQLVPRVRKRVPRKHPTHYYTIVLSLHPCFYVVYAAFWPHHPNVTAEIQTHHQRFSYFLLSNFGEHVQIVASVSYSQRRSSAYPGCYDWLFELLLPSFQLEAARPFSSDLWHQQAIFKPITAAHWIFSFFRTIFCKL